MKTLIVSYLPSQEMSNTKKLLDTFISETKGEEIEHLDLLKDTPEMFTPKSLSAYGKRNYMGEELNAEEKKAMSKMDRMTEQFKKADVVAMAFPMHNFSLPASIKAYFDSILLKGETWDIKNGFVGLMKGKKALIMISSGGIYEGAMASWEHAMSLAKLEFKFMGFEDIRGIHAGGMNSLSKEKAQEAVNNCQDQVKETVKDWYKS